MRGKHKSSEKSRDTDVAVGDVEEDKRPKKKARKSRTSKKTKAAVIEETLDASGHSGLTDITNNGSDGESISTPTDLLDANIDPVLWSPPRGMVNMGGTGSVVQSPVGGPNDDLDPFSVDNGRRCSGDRRAVQSPIQDELELDVSEPLRVSDCLLLDSATWLLWFKETWIYFDQYDLGAHFEVVFKLMTIFKGHGGFTNPKGAKYLFGKMH